MFHSYLGLLEGFWEGMPGLHKSSASGWKWTIFSWAKQDAEKQLGVIISGLNHVDWETMQTGESHQSDWIKIICANCLTLIGDDKLCISTYVGSCLIGLLVSSWIMYSSRFDTRTIYDFLCRANCQTSAGRSPSWVIDPIESISNSTVFHEQ